MEYMAFYPAMTAPTTTQKTAASSMQTSSSSTSSSSENTSTTSYEDTDTAKQASSTEDTSTTSENISEDSSEETSENTPSFFDMLFADQKNAASGEITIDTTKIGNTEDSQQNTGLCFSTLQDNTLGILLNGELAGEMTTEEAENLISTLGGSNLLDGIENKEELVEALNSLLAGLPQENQAALNKAGQLVTPSLTTETTDETETLASLIATGLTEEELAAILEAFQQKASQDFDINEELQGVIAGTIVMAPPQEQTTTQTLPLTTSGSSTEGEILTDEEIGMAGQAAVSLSPSTGQSAPTGPSASSTEGETVTTASTEGTTTATSEDVSFDNTIEETETTRRTVRTNNSQTKEGYTYNKNDSSKGSDSVNSAANDTGSDGTTLLDGSDFALNGDLLSSNALTEEIMQQLGLQPSGQYVSHSANLTQVSAQAQYAGAPHPSSQIAASQVQKLAQSGTSQTMTLDMDPPELGRIKVSLELEADSKNVKAHMLIEKPETHLMLQRDSHLLQQALQDAGLEVDGGSIDFELAQDGSEFGQNSDLDNNNSSGNHSNGLGSEESSEIIETVMSWYVDAETGMQHYDLIA